MRLVVCVDRDDDLGRKAGIKGPVIGREAVLDAAMRLGVVDPEDSDTNAMLAGVNLLDEFKRENVECEVVVLTGHERVGVTSDSHIASQFDEVLTKIDVTSLYLVSDGVEDEYVFPILSSRKPVDSVRRVYVRQSASLQGTYYTLTKALKDRKLRFKTILPLAAFLIFLGIVESLSMFYGLNIWSYGAIILLIFLGVYLVFWTFDIDEWLLEQGQSFGSDLRSGSVVVFLGVIAAVFVILGWLLGQQAATSASNPSPGYHIYTFLYNALFWWLLAVVAWEAGRAIHDTMVGNGWPSSFWVVGVSVTAFGVESYSLLNIAASMLGVISLANDLPYEIGVALGIVMGVFAGALRQHLQLREKDAAESPTTT
jgi:putative membrane protein